VTTTTTKTTPSEIFEATESAYSGRNGCACGCLGNYAERAREEDQRKLRTRTNRALKLWAESGPLAVHYWPGREDGDLYVSVRTGRDEQLLALYLYADRLGLTQEAAEALEVLAKDWSGTVLELINAAAEVSK
jgi:hypothetical protein